MSTGIPGMDKRRDGMPIGEPEEAGLLVTRWRFLSYLSGLLTAGIAAALALPLIRFYVGNAFRAKQARWLKLGPTSDVQPGQPRLFRISYADQDGWRQTIARQDVYAVTEHARLLSLSEATLRELTKSDPAIAATLLLNISKMLCLRLLRAH